MKVDAIVAIYGEHVYRLLTDVRPEPGGEQGDAYWHVEVEQVSPSFYRLPHGAGKRVGAAIKDGMDSIARALAETVRADLFGPGGREER